MKHLVFTLLVVIIPHFLFAQTVTLTIHTIDSYTALPLDSVEVYLYRNGELLDSALTGAQGTAQFTITGIGRQDNLLPTDFTLSAGYPNPFADETSVNVAVPQADVLNQSYSNALQR